MSPPDHGRSIPPHANSAASCRSLDVLVACAHFGTRRAGVAPLGGRDEAADSPGRSIPVGWPRPACAPTSWIDLGRASLAPRAELVEEDVRGDLERAARSVSGAVGRAARVLQHQAAELEAAGVVETVPGVMMPALQRRHRRDRLERRAGRIGRRDRAVEQRRAVALRVELRRTALRERLGEQVRVEARIGAEREHLAVARVQRDERARLGAGCRSRSRRRSRASSRCWPPRCSPRSSVSRSWSPWIGRRRWPGACRRGCRAR